MQAGVFFTTNGKWYLTGDTVHLFSYDIPTDKEPVIRQLLVTNDSLLKIFVADTSKSNVPFEYEYANVKHYSTDTLTIRKDIISDTLKIYPFTYDTVLLAVNQIKSGTVQIAVKPKPSFYFDNKQFIVKANRLTELTQNNTKVLELKRH